MPSAIEQIIKWAQGLPSWQADAVRRLLEQGDLTPDDRSELYQMLKVDAGIESVCVEPVFPDIGGFSGTGSTQQPVSLARVLDVQHVNAVKNGSTIPFGMQGMTVIYGQNGSGKSSYARILKRACRARDTKEPIHPNVFDPAEKGPATATIKISEGSSVGIMLPWTDGLPADERLTTVSFFDSKCAQVIVDENNEAVYIPHGCYVFDGLVDLLKAFRSRLQSERPIPQEPSGSNVVSGTKSHAFLLQLSRNSKPEEVDAATKWTEEDEKSLTDTLARIAQSQTKETLEKARRLRAISLRTSELTTAIKACLKALSAAAVTTLNEQIGNVVAAEKALALAAQTDLKAEPLAAGSSDEWRLLYEAAREYSTKIAYPSLEYPATGPDDLCVLCQQNLDEEARARLLRFKQFMGDKSKQALQDARGALNNAVSNLRQLAIPRAEDFANVLEELVPATKEQLELFVAHLSIERTKLLEAGIKVQKLEDILHLQDPTAALTQLKTKLEELAAQAEQDADPATLKKLQILRDDLASRKFLSQIKPTIQTYVEQRKLEFRHEQAINKLSTRAISEKSKEIISETLSPQLQGDLKYEIEKLGATHLPLNVNITGRDGGARHKLTLAKNVRSAKLSEILSEGEQCVVAVAGFLAELGGTSVMSPIVLDDPVSSLDHRYSRYIARRLVEEAKKRQVIVFTHNIAFLVEIEKLCAGIPLLVQTVQRTGQVPGCCIEGLPWEAMSVKDRLHFLDDRVNDIQKIHGVDDDEYNSKAAYVYDLLRQTWEALIERELLNQTVVRHDIDVQTKRLMQVDILDDDCVRVQQGMSKCSTWMAGHDKSLALDVNRPPPKEIRDDIQEVRAFAKVIGVRRNETRERRKAVLEPQIAALG